MKKKLVIFITLFSLITLIYFSFFYRSLPKEYKLWTDDKYWHTALLRKNNIVVPPTVVDHYVYEEYLMVLSVNRDSHYSKRECQSCLSHTLPCARYWVINWKTGEKTKPMNKKKFLGFIESKSIPYSNLNYNISNFSGNECKTKAKK